MARALVLATFVVVAADLSEVLPIEGEGEVVEELGEMNGGLVADFVVHDEVRSPFCISWYSVPPGKPDVVHRLRGRYRVAPAGGGGSYPRSGEC